MSGSKEKLELMVGKIFTSNAIFETIKDLCLLGSRFSGTESEKQAQEFMIAFLRNIGIEPITHEFEYQGWLRQTCKFYIQKPISIEFPAISLVLAPSTNEEDLEGVIVNGGAGSKTELEKIKDKIKGNILLVHSGETKEGWLHRRIKYANAVEYGAKGFIFANHNPGQLFPTGSVRSNRIGEIPAIGISKETYEHIKELIKRRNLVSGKMYVENKSEITTSKHIIWEIPGEKESEVIIIGGHYDGHDIAQGATDNAGSIAVLLELTKIMKEVNFKPKRTVRFIAFAVEEFGVVGSTIYVNKSNLSNVVAMINLDGLVGYIPKLITSNGDEDLHQVLEGIKGDLLYDCVLGKNIITASDNYPFLCKGIPNLCIYGIRSDPKAGRGYGHTSADTFDKISKVDSKLSLAFTLTFLDEFSKLDKLPKRKTESETIKMLKDANLEESLKLLEKWSFG